MLSENGFEMHLKNIRHSSNMYNAYGGVANLESSKNSETVLLKNFKELKKENEFLKRKIELLEKGVCSNSCLADIEDELKQIDKEIKKGNEIG